jgi:hypothetical protein
MTSTTAQTRAARAAKQAERRAAKRDAALAEASTLCGCGCGAAVTRRYLPGHDARHKGQLLLAWDAGQTTDADLALLAGFGYDAARLQERREADEADAAAREAKAEAKRQKALAKAEAKAAAAKERAKAQAAKAKAHERKVAALQREQAN